MKYERITMREFAGVTGDNIYNRLAEHEDKIEDGTLVEVPKEVVVYTPGVVLTPEERTEEMRLCNEERKRAVKEFAEKLKSHVILNYTMDGEFVEDVNIWSLFNDIDDLVEEEKQQ